MANTQEQVDRLIERFGHIFGARFTAELRGEDREQTRGKVRRAKTEWAETLAGLTDEQVEQGIRTAKFRCDWPPSHAQFVRYALGLPEAGQVIARIARGDTDDLVRAVCRAAGGRRNVTLVDAREQARIVERVYAELVEDMVRDVAKGQAVDPAARLEAPAPAVDPPEHRLPQESRAVCDAIPHNLTAGEKQ